MANNVEQLADLVVAAYLESNSNKTISNAFKKNKKISAGPEFNKLIEIINFFNTKAPVKNRLVLPGAAKATKNEINPSKTSNAESKERINSLLRELQNEVDNMTWENVPKNDTTKTANEAKKPESKMEESSSSDDSDSDTEMKDVSKTTPASLPKTSTETKKK